MSTMSATNYQSAKSATRRLLVVFLAAIPLTAIAKDPPHFFYGFFRTYLEQYAAASLPENAPDHVAVVGYVNKPGVLPISSGLTLSKAVEASAGFADWADRRHVGLWRNAEGRFYTIDQRALANHEYGATDPVLEKGDVVVVISRHM